jgi:hypothetical protein
LEFRAALPILPGDEIDLLGVLDGGNLAWSFDEDLLRVEVHKSAVEKGAHAWVFRVKYLA